MKRAHLTLAAFAAAGLAGLPAFAEVLVVDVIAEEPANTASGLPRPHTGMSMMQVEGQFGTPEQKLAPVGTPGSIHQPPITRWVYPKYTVYFENDRVITSVINR